MKCIEVKKWKSKIINEKKEIEEIEEDTLKVLTVLVNLKRPEDMPKGLDSFRIMNRLSKAFDKADKSGKLELELVDYKFLKDIIEKDIPSAWGRNPNITDAIDSFLSPRDE